jgi:hypothetical protein
MPIPTATPGCDCGRGLVLPTGAYDDASASHPVITS